MAWNSSRSSFEPCLLLWLSLPSTSSGHQKRRISSG